MRGRLFLREIVKNKGTFKEQFHQELGIFETLGLVGEGVDGRRNLLIRYSVTALFVEQLDQVGYS